ncbi:MAG: hypothetical protein J7J98_09490 [candidate division Zixibacteria bacterium]|nr:hypothetical protein [candidate division Zixibacteria bacterium]
MKSSLKIALILSLTLVGSAWCAAGTEQSTSNTVVDTSAENLWCRVGVDHVTVDDGQLYDTLDVYFETGGIDLAGYVLKLGLASHLVGIVEILPGEIIDSCGWEMFRANRITPNPVASQIFELWQITALAQIGLSEAPPICFGFDRPVSLARLVVSSVHVPIAPDTSIAIFFYWEACRDNVLSDREGASILVSDTVINSCPIVFETERDQFPTCYGTPSKCISPTAVNIPRRLIEFQNGGVEFRLRIDPADPDSTKMAEPPRGSTLQDSSTDSR